MQKSARTRTFGAKPVLMASFDRAMACRSPARGAEHRADALAIRRKRRPGHTPIGLDRFGFNLDSLLYDIGFRVRPLHVVTSLGRPGGRHQSGVPGNSAWRITIVCGSGSLSQEYRRLGGGAGGAGAIRGCMADIRSSRSLALAAACMPARTLSHRSCRSASVLSRSASSAARFLPVYRRCRQA